MLAGLATAGAAGPALGKVASSIAGSSAAASDAMLAPSAMRADVALLRRAYGLLHPGLWRYESAAGMEARFDALAAAASRPMSLTAFWLELSRLLTATRCGHSFVNPANQSDAVAGALFGQANRLPVEFLWLDDRMVVTRDPFGTGIAPGSVICSVDGRPAGAILASLMRLARADGHNDAKRRRLLSVQGGERWESFDLFFGALYGRPRYVLEVEGRDGRRRRATLDAVSLDRRRAVSVAAERAEGAPAWTIERRGGAALLTMPSWALYGDRWDWRGWLDAEMDRLIADGVPRLVVDLRTNEGGQDCGIVLAERLLERPVPFEEMRRLVRYRSIPADLRPHLDTWDRSFDRLGEGAARVDDLFYRLPDVGSGEEGDGMIRPRGRRYTGEVRVLVGPQNSSATFQFAELAKRAHVATLMGETTGGNRRGLNGGCFYFLRLPGSGLEADLPLVGRYPLSPQPDAGVEPDVAVPVTAGDVARGRDAVLERALA